MYRQVAKMFDGMPKEPMGIPATTVGKKIKIMDHKKKNFREILRSRRMRMRKRKRIKYTFSVSAVVKERTRTSW